MAPTIDHDMSAVTHRPVMRGTTVEAGGETFKFATPVEAIEALRFLSVADTEAVFRCSWAVELTGDRLPPEVDFPSDLVGNCDAPARGTARGWECFHGHSHVSGASYFDDDEVSARRLAEMPFPVDSYTMDGRRLA